MNSKQDSRCIKRRVGDDLKNQILVRNGIISKDSAAAQRKPSVLTCARCSLVNAVDNKFCSKCSYPLTPQAYEEIKALLFVGDNDVGQIGLEFFSILRIVHYVT